MRNQQPIQKKGGGRAIHVSDFICETIGRVKLSEEQVHMQLKLPAELHLAAFEAQKIIYPGKGFDAWWDLTQLIKQVKNVLSIFEYTHPGCVSIFVFDRSSTHEGFAEDALNTNAINVHPRWKQKKMHDSIIPWNNPDLAPGEEDTCGQVQQMCFPDDHEDPKLRGQPKGVRAILIEWKSVWDKYTAICKVRSMKVVRKCGSCTKSQVQKDAERRVAKVEEMEQQEDIVKT